MIENKLKVIDFSAALRSEPLNYNFDIVKGWVDRERLRTGGYGLVEGFDISYAGNYFVDISEGILIDRVGEEIIVPATRIQFAPPTYEKIMERVQVSDDGEILLKYCPYSPSAEGLISVNAYRATNYKTEELVISDPSGTLGNLKPINVDGRKVGVTTRSAGLIVEVEYFYCNDRIDAIMINDQAQYSTEFGINAESPSVANIDLGPRFLIAFAHWIVGETIDVEFIVDERTYRKVYVDKLNRLFLNGKLYQEPKFIYFVEPESPEENDVWYDYKSNTLNIWSQNGGVWGWRIMNDFTNVPLRSVKMWTEKDFPSDAQTFLFKDDETNFRYIPNTNALEIIIDQQTVMKDQFTEVVQAGAKPYLSSGIGFKLIEPLDRPTVVQCIVHHVVKNAPLRNVFQRAAIFTTENFFPYNATANPQKIFITDLPYVIKATQLEVFLEGRRLTRDVDFAEMVTNEKNATDADKDKTTKYFRIMCNVADGQRISYKISRYVWSYDQLNEMMDEIEQKADKALKNTATLNDKVDTMSSNIGTVLDSLKGRLQQAEEKLDTLKDYRKTAEKIKLADLDSDLRKSLVKSRAQLVFNASNVDNIINDCKKEDYVSIVCVNSEGITPLNEDSEYSLTYNNGKATIELESEWMSPDNTLYVNIIRIGR